MGWKWPMFKMCLFNSVRENVSPQTAQACPLAVWLFIWLFKLPFVLNDLPQTLHRWGFSSLWTTVWAFSFSFCTCDFPHIVHVCCMSTSSWILMCFFKCSTDVDNFPHLLHEHGFSVARFGPWVHKVFFIAKVFLFCPKCVFISVCKFLFWANMAHVCVVSPLCTKKCLRNFSFLVNVFLQKSHL